MKLIVLAAVSVCFAVSPCFACDRSDVRATSLALTIPLGFQSCDAAPVALLVAPVIEPLFLVPRPVLTPQRVLVPSRNFKTFPNRDFRVRRR